MSARPAIAAVPLGCCSEPRRCLLCAPPPPAPDPAAITALAVHTEVERAREDQPVWVGFYGGRPPTDDELAALEGRPFTARVRPDLFSRADARRLARAGAVSIELDALSLDNRVLRGIDRRYRQALVLEQLQGIRALRVQVGVVLAPGLPGSSHATALQDARLVADLVDTARLHPVLVLRDSGLQEAHMDGTYAPLTLGEAVTVCRDLMDLLEQAGVRVLRVGQQPGPDGLGTAVAGPRHSSLRELVEARRALDTLRSLLDDGPDGGHVIVMCAPADLSRTRGPLNQHVRTLRAEFGLDSLRVQPDPGLPRGRWRVIEAVG